MRVIVVKVNRCGKRRWEFLQISRKRRDIPVEKWVKEVSRQFIDMEAPMTNKPMKRCSQCKLESVQEITSHPTE